MGARGHLLRAAERRAGMAMAEAGRIATGVAGLDEVLHGGLPGPRLYLLRGRAGTGKTTMALQFLIEGVRQGQPVLYVSLSQTEKELRQIAQSHGWSLDGVTVQSLSREDMPADPSEQTIFQSANLRLDKTRDAIEHLVQEMAPKRIVYDSLLEIRLLAADWSRFRREVLGYKTMLADQDVTALLLDTEHGGKSDRAEDQLENIAHGMIRLDKQVPNYGTVRRRLEVEKMRGTEVRDGFHDMSIRRGGIEVYPRVVPDVNPDEPFDRTLIKCDIEQIDAMLGGGLEAGTTALFVGQSGTGKSTLASLYARAALERGENVAMFLFEERPDTFFRRSEGLGIELRDYHERGNLLLREFNPAEVSPGEFARIVESAIEEHQARVLVIDSFTSYLSCLPDGREAMQQLHSLLKYAARRGVLTMLIVAQHGLLGREQGGNLDVSFLGDSLLLLRMYEWPGVIRRTITAVKKRHGPHALDVHEFVLKDGAVDVVQFNPPPPGDAGPLGER